MVERADPFTAWELDDALVGAGVAGAWEWPVEVLVSSRLVGLVGAGDRLTLVEVAFADGCVALLTGGRA